jgi:xylulokinase
VPPRAPTAQAVLAIDHGTSGLKTALVSTHGEVLSFAFEPVPTATTPDGGVMQDPEAWWRALLATGARAVAQAGVPPADIVAVACSSTFSTTVAVDDHGRHLMDALTWMDARGAPHVRARMRGHVNLLGYGLSKAARFIWKTGGGPTLSGKDDAAHALWLKHERPEIYGRAAALLPSKDYLNARLTGRVAATIDSMALFWATDNRDAHDIHYDDGLIRLLGLDREKLPPLIRATDVLAPLHDEVADALGLAHGTPVVGGSADLQAACVGSGAVRDFDAHLYLGTSSWILAHVPFKKTDPLHAIASLPAALPGRYFAANEQDMAGGCLGFLLENLLFHQNALQTTPLPDDAYARLDQVVSQAPPGSGGLLFTPWLNGEKTPVDSETLRGGFHNLSLHHTTEHLARAVYEGVAYNSRWLLGHLERFLGRRPASLALIGGGARSEVWAQIMADVLDRPIHRVRDPLQANARGAAFLAALALDILTVDDIPGLVEHDATFTPDAADRALHAERFDAYLDLHRRTRGWFDRINRMTNFE